MKETYTIPDQSLSRIMQVVSDNNNRLLFNLNDTLHLEATDTSENYYTIHTVQNKETYQSISYHYYKTTKLWWLITKFNNIDNVLELPEVGSQLKILAGSIKDSIINQIDSIYRKNLNSFK